MMVGLTRSIHYIELVCSEIQRTAFQSLGNEHDWLGHTPTIPRVCGRSAMLNVL